MHVEAGELDVGNGRYALKLKLRAGDPEPFVKTGAGAAVAPINRGPGSSRMPERANG